MAEYIEREALLAAYDKAHKGPPGGARKLMEEAPAVDVVPVGVLGQIRWERDTAMQQLEEHGVPFCGKADDVVHVVRCKDCKYCDPENHHCDHPAGTMVYFPKKPDDFCSYGERRDSDV